MVDKIGKGSIDKTVRCVFVFEFGRVALRVLSRVWQKHVRHDPNLGAKVIAKDMQEKKDWRSRSAL